MNLCFGRRENAVGAAFPYPVRMFLLLTLIRLYPVKLRYVWPAELDLMAQLAGLELRHRWADWRKAAFSADSGKHISVYEHAQ